MFAKKEPKNPVVTYPKQGLAENRYTADGKIWAASNLVSWVKEKNSNRYLEFSPDLEGMNIIIEYLSNNTVGVEECAINVDENLSNALEYFIKFKLLENGIETMQQAQYYWRKFKAIRDKELTKENALTKTDLYGLLLLK